ncbi:MAG TPA: VanW family protein [Patescibacteria group bacterium]|nr:VanW family protein [Patescibacteria group bacterium]
MTTTAPAPPTRGFPYGKLILGAVAGFVLVLGFGAGALFAYQGQYAERIFPGVTVDGVAVAGLSRDAATTLLEHELAGYGAGEVVIDVDGTQIRIPYASLGRRADITTLVDLAWSVGRSELDPIGRAALGVRGWLEGTRIAPLVVLDPVAVGAEVTRAAGALTVTPVSATATATETGFATTPAAAGRGLPREEIALALLERLVDPAAPAILEIAVEWVPLEPFVDDAEVAAAVAVAERMARDVTLAHAGEAWTIEATVVRSWITFNPTVVGGTRPTVAPTAPTAALTELAAKVDRAPKDATFLVGRGATPVGVVAGRDGLALDIAASARLVAQAVVDRASAPDTETPPDVALATTVIEPTLTTAEAQQVAPLMERLSTWTTGFSRSEANGFGVNITIPTNDINGHVVQPGAIFDFWAALGPITHERGYRDGGVIIDGRTEPTGALAGGICSVSTTVFNAAARAGLEILERANHYYYIDRYPVGLDATVWKTAGATRSVRFRNDTEYPLLIRGLNGVGFVRFEIWGPPTGRTVTLARPVIEDVVRATDSVQETTTIPVGTRERIEHPVDGMQVWVTRTVLDAAGTVVHRNTWHSNYRRVNGIVLVGVAPTESAPPPTPPPPASPPPPPPPPPAAP